jgi:MoaA/NifB/PqqE/SkfB family radical SAM enzyme
MKVNKLDKKLSEVREMSKRSVIYPTMRCNINCPFCYYKDLEEKSDIPISKIKRELWTLRNIYKFEYIDISGGEPTIYPYIKEVVYYSNKIGIKPTIITNALNSNLLKRLILKEGLEDLLISIQGINDVHNKAVGYKGAFQKVLKTIEMLKDLKFSFRINTTIISYNYKLLPKMASFFVKIGPRIVNFIAFNPHERGGWAKKMPPFQVKYSEIAPYLKEAIDVLMTNQIWVNVRYFPLCVLNGYEKHVCNFCQWQYDPYEWRNIIPKTMEKFFIEEAVKENVFGETPDEKLLNYVNKFLHGWNKKELAVKWIKYLIKSKLKGLTLSNIRADLPYYLSAIRRRDSGVMGENILIDNCKKCANYFICDGVYPQYITRFGSEEFKPIQGEYIRDPIYYRKEDLRWAVLKKDIYKLEEQ